MDLFEHVLNINSSIKCQCAQLVCTHCSLPSIGSPPPDFSALNVKIDEQILDKRKIPKRKCKFKKGATRGGNQKSCRSNRADGHVLVVKECATADDCINSDSTIVKWMNKKQH
jgi:hypothetical protein